jgi:hypothetical protein
MQMQVCVHIFLPELHISFLEVGRKKAMLWYGLGEEPNTIERSESTIQGVHVNYALFQKVYKNLQVTKIRKWDEMTLFWSPSTFQPLKKIC